MGTLRMPLDVQRHGGRRGETPSPELHWLQGSAATFSVEEEEEAARQHVEHCESVSVTAPQPLKLPAKH